jgi:hypothetical protein
LLWFGWHNAHFVEETIELLAISIVAGAPITTLNQCGFLDDWPSACAVCAWVAA